METTTYRDIQSAVNNSKDHGPSLWTRLIWYCLFIHLNDRNGGVCCWIYIRHWPGTRSHHHASTSEIACLSISVSKISNTGGRNWDRLKPPSYSPYSRHVFGVSHCPNLSAVLHFGILVSSLQHRGQGVTPSINSLSQQAHNGSKCTLQILSTFHFPRVYSLFPI